MLEKLNDYYERGYLIKQVHPTLPLIVWNYSQTTQFERAWDDVTLMCRGLVTDEEGNIVARPFPKFFNIEEDNHTPTEDFHVFEKMDGSLGILFCYEGEWVFASRGSFTSEQALKFKEIFMRNHGNELIFLDKDATYMFEIIYPENRIVVDYEGQEGAVMLGKRLTECGSDFTLDKYKEFRFDTVKKYNGIKDFTELKDKIEDDAEGFVVLFTNGDRCKIKGEEYVRLHRIMTQLSTTSVWDVLAHGGKMETLLINVPDEFYDKIRAYEKELRDEFEAIGFGAKEYYNILVERVGTENRKRFAEYANSYKYSGLIFAQLDGRPLTESIWKLIKPKYKAL